MMFLTEREEEEYVIRDNTKRKEINWAYFEARGPLINGYEGLFGRQNPKRKKRNSTTSMN